MVSMLGGFTKLMSGAGSGSITPKKESMTTPLSTTPKSTPCDMFENYFPVNPYDNHKAEWKQNYVDVQRTSIGDYYDG